MALNGEGVTVRHEVGPKPRLILQGFSPFCSTHPECLRHALHTLCFFSLAMILPPSGCTVLILHVPLWGSWLHLLPPRLRHPLAATQDPWLPELGMATPDQDRREERPARWPGAQGCGRPPTVMLRWMSASSKATVEELRPAGCTAMDRGNRKKTIREEITRQMRTARNTKSFLWEREQDPG